MGCPAFDTHDERLRAAFMNLVAGEQPLGPLELMATLRSPGGRYGFGTA
jgi:hypothetical protein